MHQKKKTNVYLPESLFAAIKTVAESQNRSMNNYIHVTLEKDPHIAKALHEQGK